MLSCSAEPPRLYEQSVFPSLVRRASEKNGAARKVEAPGFSRPFFADVFFFRSLDGLSRRKEGLLDSLSVFLNNPFHYHMLERGNDRTRTLTLRIIRLEKTDVFQFNFLYAISLRLTLSCG